MKRTWIAGIAITATALICTMGCEDDPVGATTTYTVTGAVTLNGSMRDATGAVLGPLEVAGQTGVRVLLVRDGRDLQSTVLSDSGAVVFERVPPGTYQMASTVNNSDFILGTAFTVDDTSVVAPDTLRVTTQGDAAAWPNPSPSTSSPPTIRVTLAASGTLGINILAADQTLVRALVSEQRPAGTYDLVWDRKNTFGIEVADGAYWALINAAGELQHELIVLESP